MPYVVEITGYNQTAAAEQTLRYAVGQGIAFTDTTMAPSAVVSWSSPTQKVDVSKAGGIDLAGDKGTLVLANYPNDLLTPGPLDALATSWVWLGRRANLYYVPAALWSARTIVATGILEQPVASLSQDSNLQSTINFPLRDPRSLLDRPLQPTKYLGQAENLFTWSQSIDAWGLTGGTVSLDTAIAPDGTLTADKLAETTATSQHVVQVSGTVTSGVQITGSVFVKAAERTRVRVLLLDTSTGTHYYGQDINLSTGANLLTWDSANLTGVKTGAINVGNGWWRVWATAISSGTGFSIYVNLEDGTGATSYTGTLGSGAYIWGAQLNYGDTPKAYALTTSAVVQQSDVEGDPDVKGKVKPIVYGTASNVPGVRVSQSKLIWQAADKAATVMCVRDGGASLTLGTVRGSLASLLSTIPNPGTYDTYAGAEGTFVRLGTKPQKGIGIDVQEATSRTNLVLQSQTLGTTWTQAACTIGSNVINAPDGTLTADKIQEDNTNAEHGTVQGITAVLGQSYTFSVYVKSAERTQAGIVTYTGGDVAAGLFDLTTGALITRVSAGAPGDFGLAAVAVGGGWWRLSITWAAVTGTSMTFYFEPGNANQFGYTGTTGSGIYAWGAQVEANPAPTGYIATTTAAVTVFDEGGRTHAQIWNRLRRQRCAGLSSQINYAALVTADAVDTHEVGFYFDQDSTTQLDAVNAVLTSFSGYEVQGLDLNWTVAKLVAPTGPSVIDLEIASISDFMDASDRPLRALTKVRPAFAPDGAPPYRVNVRWGNNNSVMADGDFVGVASQRLREKFATEWRVETATNTAIWDPTTLTGPWVNAPELTIDTGYQPGADTLTCPHAATEAARALALYSALPGQYQVGYIAEPTDQILPGQVVTLRHPQMGLAGAPYFRVLQSGFSVDINGPKTDLVIGFQNAAPRRLVFIGDSILQANNSALSPAFSTIANGEIFTAQAQYPYFECDSWLDAMDDHQISGCNLGQSGWRADELFRLLPRARTMGADAFLVSAGINDIGQSQTGASTAADIIAFATTLAALGKPVMVTNIRCYGDGTKYTQLVAANNALDAWWATNPTNIIPIDVRSIYSTSTSDPTPLTGLTTDGTHPTPKGAQKAISVFKPALQKVFKPTLDVRPTGLNLHTNPKVAGTGGSVGTNTTGTVGALWIAQKLSGTSTVVAAKTAADRQQFTITHGASGLSTEAFFLSGDFGYSNAAVSGHWYQWWFEIQTDGWAGFKNFRAAAGALGEAMYGDGTVDGFPNTNPLYELIISAPVLAQASGNINVGLFAYLDGTVAGSGVLTILEAGMAEVPDPRPLHNF